METNDRILVTGAQGLVGSAIVERLKIKGFSRVIEVGRRECDLTSPKDVACLFKHEKPDYVFHMAARVYGIIGNLKNKGISFYENLMINTNVIEASQKVGVKKIVAMGTIAAYPGLIKRETVGEEMIFEGAPHDSEDSYGFAKRAMLAMLKAYGESYGLKWAYIISTNLYGAGDRFDIETGHVVPSLIKKIYDAKRGNNEVVIWGDGSAKRDFMYVKDMAKAAHMIMEKSEGPINVVSGEVISIKQLVEILLEISEMKCKISWDITKPNGREYISYNMNKLHSIGFTTDYTIRSGLEETWNWYIENESIARVL